ncbi:MAG TPA: urate hydroxylase PuuD [Candidatus Sulfotelmatobacter sp.]|nr:urate hydroxylase PuuD [Candidatus Sulfotelmatobacter sp.]
MNPFNKLSHTILLGLIITLILVVLLGAFTPDHAWASFFFRWLHVLSGVMWIGLLWYFNFVQTPSMPKIPAEQRPAITKFIAPTALFWFRWAALSTVITGLIEAWLNGYIGDALALGALDGVPKDRAIGVGMWFGLIMAFNVWFIIWPNQQKVLGLVEASADERAAAGKKAGMASRFNTMLSVPLLYLMVAAQNIF